MPKSHPTPFTSRHALLGIALLIFFFIWPIFLSITILALLGIVLSQRALEIVALLLLLATPVVLSWLLYRHYKTRTIIGWVTGTFLISTTILFLLLRTLK